MSYREEYSKWIGFYIGIFALILAFSGFAFRSDALVTTGIILSFIAFGIAIYFNFDSLFRNNDAFDSIFKNKNKDKEK